MLLELSVQDLAVIESCELSLRSGFTALTGETGAGKSLLIDAIGARGAQGRYADALDLAEPLRREPGFCESVRRRLEPWSQLRGLPEDLAARQRALVAPCP